MKRPLQILTLLLTLAGLANAQTESVANATNNTMAAQVNVHWADGPNRDDAYFENFETGDFAQFPWNNDGTYPWEISTEHPYKGTYCMRSTNYNISSSTSSIDVTLDIPDDGVIYFFGYISSETSWDHGRFYIDDTQVSSFTGLLDTWKEYAFPVTAGTHNFKWVYEKDGSYNLGEDRFYVDNITFYKEPILLESGWHTYAKGDFDNSVGSVFGVDRWAYEYPIHLLSSYVGYAITKVSLYSDDIYNAVGGNYTCTIYRGGDEPMVGEVVTSLTVDVPQGLGEWVDWDLPTPVIVTSANPLWVVWVANTTVSDWPAGCNGDYLIGEGTWWNPCLEDGCGWEHNYFGTWTMRQRFDIVVGDLIYSVNPDDTTVTVVGHKDGTAATGALTIPSTVTFGSNTYSVTAIGDKAFRYCSGFTGSLTLPNSVTTIGDYAFNGCYGFTGDLTIPNSVTTIGEYAFDACSGFTGSLTLPNSVTTIGDYAFNGLSGFTGDLTIPNSVTTIGDGAFGYCNGFTGSLTIPNSVDTIGSYAFIGCTGFTGSLILPNSVSEIGSHAFYNCSGLTGSLTIPNSVTTIGNYAFCDCSGFTGSLTIPDSVVSIGNYAFLGCTGLTGCLTIGSSVTTIGQKAFENCTGITIILALPVTPPSLGVSAFESININIPVYVSCGVEDDYENADQWGDFTDIREQCDLVIADVAAVDYSPDPNDINSSAVEVRWGGIDDFESGDFSRIAWLQDPNFPWQITADTPYEGNFNMKSSNEGYDNSTSAIELAVNIPIECELSFYAHTSCENGYDFGYFYIDDVLSNSWTGINDWQETVFTLSAGVHVLKWAYEKDYSQSYGEDCFQVDCIRFSNPVPENNYSFEGSFEGWTSIDADGDGFNWDLASVIQAGYNLPAHSGADCVSSESYSNHFSMALTPDNYLVSPQIELGGSISFWACAQDNSWAAEHFGVAVSTTNNTNASAFTTIQEWTMTAKSTGPVGNYMTRSRSNRTGNWYEYTVDLSAFSGQGYVAIRHFGCTDQFMLDVDDIQIISPSGVSLYRAHCDGSDQQLIATTTEANYIDTDWASLDEGSYKYGVSFLEGPFVWTNCITKYAEPCDIVFTFNDSFGDGWNGNKLSVDLDYGNQNYNLTLESGYMSTYTLAIPDGLHVSLDWLPLETSFPYECSFTVAYANGNVICEGTNLEESFAYDFNVDCVNANTYDITVSADPTEGGTITGDGTYNHGESCTLTATANEGYTFLNWTNGSTEVSTEATYTFTVSETTSYVAHFELNSYEITATAEPTTGGTISGAGTYNHGESCTLTATANEGYTFLYWNNGGTEVSTEATYTFTVTETASYVAHFELNIYGITVTATPGTGGTVTGEGIYAHGESCMLTATANEGFTFTDWSKGGTVVSTDATYTFTVTEDASYVAHFELNSYEITATANPSAGGTVTGEGTYNHGESCMLTATSNEGYTFVNWTKGGTVVSTDATYIFTVTEAASYVAHFELNSYVITATADPTEGGTITGTGTYNHGESCTLTATANEGYTFVNWTKGSTIVSTNAIYTFTVTEAASYVAHFELNSYVITATANPTEGGTISGAGTYDHGESCTLIASASEGYAFVNWTESGSPVSTSPTYTFEVTSERTLVANFTASTYVIAASVVPEGSGTVTGAGGYEYGQSCTLTATANPGHAFINWTEGGSEVTTESAYTFTVTSSRTLVANFSTNSYDITATANPAEGGTVTGAGTYNHGQSCTLTATANEGYTFLNWTKGSAVVSTNATYTFTVTEAASYVAHFELNSYIITTDAIPSEGGTVTGAGTYEHGESCTLTATANEGYTFTNWTESGSEVSTEPIYTFTVTNSRNLVANFSTNSYEITATADPAEGGTVTGAGSYNHGESCTLTATANEGYTFVNWTKGGTVVSTDATYTFTVTDAASYVAHFMDASAGVTQTTNFVSGCNWWSGYIELNSNSLMELQDGLGTNGINIKSQNNGYNSYYEGLGWYGMLSGINNESTYQIRTTGPCTVTLTGTEIDPASHPITLTQGWSWIGYPVNVSQSLTDAFAGITAQMGDMVKSQNDGYASYLEGFGWYGAFNTLTPGMGLMYKSTSSGSITLVYPNGGSKGETKPNQKADNNHWKPNLNAYMDNMSVMAVIELDDEELRGTNYELAAFANGECRGSARLLYVAPLDRYMAFLTVAGEETAELHFGLYNTETGAVETQCAATLQYETDAVWGSFTEPYVVSFRSATGVDEWARGLNVFPNPVDQGQTVSLGFSVVETGEVQVEIINALGTVMETCRGAYLQKVTAPNTAGVYTLRITVEGKGTCYRKLVVR